MAYLHNAGHNYGGNLSTGIQQRTAKAADPAFVDGGQFKVESASGPNVRQSTHWEIQKKTWMLCSLTGLPDATAQTLMMKRSIVELDSKGSKHGGRHVKIGWHASKRTVNRSAMTSRSC